MDAIPSAALDPSVTGLDQNLSNVTIDNGSSINSDFAKMIDDYRARAEAMNTFSGKQAGGEGGEPANPQIKQLADLYSYAVDTQLIVRTTTQFSTGFRQMMSGQ